MRRWLVVVAALATVAACGGGGEPKPSATPTQKTATQNTPTLAGTFAPEALQHFRCSPTSKKKWAADGVLHNSGKQPVTYQVTIYVGAIGSSGQGKLRRFDHVQAGGSVRFHFKEVPAPGFDASCSAQVLIVK